MCLKVVGHVTIVINLDDIFGKVPRLYNINGNEPIPKDAVNIMRPNEFGNPFKVGVHGPVGVCCKLHREWVLGQPKLISRIKEALRGKDLVCCCYPKECHGNFLLIVANE